MLLNKCKETAIKNAVRFVMASGDDEFLNVDKLMDVLYIGDMIDYETRSIIDICDILMVLDEMITDKELEVPNNDYILLLKKLFHKNKFRTAWYHDLDGKVVTVSFTNYYRRSDVIDAMLELDDKLVNFPAMITYENIFDISHNGLADMFYPMLVKLMIKEDASTEVLKELLHSRTRQYKGSEVIKSGILTSYLRSMCELIASFEDYDYYMEVIMDDIDQMFKKCKSGIARKTAIQNLIWYEGKKDVEKIYKIMERYNNEVKEYDFFKAFEKNYNKIVAEELLD